MRFTNSKAPSCLRLKNNINLDQLSTSYLVSSFPLLRDVGHHLEQTRFHLSVKNTFSISLISYAVWIFRFWRTKLFLCFDLQALAICVRLGHVVVLLKLRPALFPFHFLINLPEDTQILTGTLLLRMT